MSRKYAQCIQFVENYLYYRRKGFYPKAAWHLARMTLPT